MTQQIYPFLNPDTSGWLCACGDEWPTRLRAMACVRCAANQPNPEPPTPWWTDNDDVILRGELAKLTSLPHPLYMEREKGRLVYVPISNVKRPGRAWREIGAWIVLLGIALGAILLLSVGGEQPMPPICTGDPAGCADLTTMPVPGPTR